MSMLSRVQAGRPGIQVAARLNRAIPGAGMPAHHQDPGRCHLCSAVNVCTVPRTSTRLDDRSFSVDGP